MDPAEEQRIRQALARIRLENPTVTEEVVEMLLREHQATSEPAKAQAFARFLFEKIAIDLRQALSGQASLTPAVAICAYMEALAGAAQGQFFALGKSQQNFDYFVREFMASHYSSLDRILIDRAQKGGYRGGLYKEVRSALVHQIVPSHQSGFSLSHTDTNNKWGIELRLDSLGKEHLYVSVKHFYGDFEAGCRRLLEAVPGDPLMVSGFLEAQDLGRREPSQPTRGGFRKSLQNRR